jgi:hypothetical protein
MAGTPVHGSRSSPEGGRAQGDGGRMRMCGFERKRGRAFALRPAVLLLLGLLGACGASGDGASLVELGVEWARSFDLLGDTAVVFSGPAAPALHFVQLRGEGAPRILHTRPLANWARHITDLKVSGDRIFLRDPRAGVVILDREGELEPRGEIRRRLPPAFAPSPQGRVYFASTRFEGVYLESAGPMLQSTRPFARRDEGSWPVLSRARSGPGLHPAVVVDREGTFHLFSNRTGVFRSYGAGGVLERAFPIEAELLQGAIARSRSALGQPGRPMARELRLGCDGELLLLLSDRRGTVLQVDPSTRTARVVGRAGRDEATLCGDLLWRLG